MSLAATTALGSLSPSIGRLNRVFDAGNETMTCYYVFNSVLTPLQCYDDNRPKIVTAFQTIKANTKYPNPTTQTLNLGGAFKAFERY